MPGRKQHDELTGTTRASAAGLGPHLRRSLPTFAAISVAGAVTGALLGGVGGRLAMSLLAYLNPDIAGVESDDGFVMGQVRLGPSLFLLFVAFTLGMLGAGIYALLRGLMIGPRWFQVLSVSVGPAVVVGNLLVHTDGVDFRLLHPPLLAIALFVALPGVYALALTLLAERWCAADSWFHRAPDGPVRATLLVWVIAFPVLPFLTALVVLWLSRRLAVRRALPAALLTHRATPWLARGGLAVTFALSAASLVSKTVDLT